MILGQLIQYRRIKGLLNRLPIQLNPKQIEQIAFDGCEEVLLGGAAGGGKTISLLVWLLEGVDIPGYNAAIFRKYQTDTKDDESALIAKAAQIYPALGGKLAGFRWQFPAGSSIVMEGIAHDSALLSKQGKEYHRVCFDELTHFSEMAYEFITTHRMRRVQGFPIRLGVRSSANPGGPSHQAVKERFITDEAIRIVRDIDVHQPTPYGMIFYKNKGTIHETAYIPSRAADNSQLDVEDYIKRLSKSKNPVERARMMNGDWGIAPEGLIKPQWFRYFTMRDKLIDLLATKHLPGGEIIHSDEVLKSYHEMESRRFITVDTAGGMKDITAASKGKPASWTVAGVWDHKRWSDGQALILRHVWRDRVGFTDVCNQLRKLYVLWSNEYIKVSRIRVEDKTMGPDLENVLRGELPIDLIPTGSQDKVSRATTACNMFEKGQIYFPKFENTWRQVYESELLGWQGLDEETNDQVDMTAYAAIESQGGVFGGTVQLATDPRKPTEMGSGKSFKTGEWIAGSVKW